MTPERRNRILTIALPIIGGMMSQNVLNLVDTAMVGTLGPAALAAVGIGGFLNFLSAAAIMGLAVGVQAMTARRIGEKRAAESAIPLNGGLVLALIVGSVLTLTAFLVAPLVFPVLNPDPAVATEGVGYFQARCLGIAAVGMNFSFRGFFTGVGLSQLYMRTLLIMHGCNVVLSYLLIFGALGFPELGAEGAGLGTAISVWIGTGIYFSLAWRRARINGFFHRVPGRDTMLTMARLSVPSAIQQFLFAAGMTTLFWIIGQVGTAETAASNVLVNLFLVALLPGMGLGMAATTLVSEALGRRDPQEARGWARDVLKITCTVLALLGLPALIVPELLLSGFIHDDAVLQLAVAPLRLVGVIMAVEAAGLIFMNALYGAGATRAVMLVSVLTQWLLGLPLAWLLGPYLGLGLFAIWLGFMSYRLLLTAIFAVVWTRGGWESIRI